MWTSPQLQFKPWTFDLQSSVLPVTPLRYFFRLFVIFSNMRRWMQVVYVIVSLRFIDWPGSPVIPYIICLCCLSSSELWSPPQPVFNPRTSVCYRLHNTDISPISSLSSPLGKVDPDFTYCSNRCTMIFFCTMIYLSKYMHIATWTEIIWRFRWTYSVSFCSGAIL